MERVTKANHTNAVIVKHFITLLPDYLQ